MPNPPSSFSSAAVVRRSCPPVARFKFGVAARKAMLQLDDTGASGRIERSSVTIKDQWQATLRFAGHCVRRTRRLRQPLAGRDSCPALSQPGMCRCHSRGRYTAARGSCRFADHPSGYAPRRSCHTDTPRRGCQETLAGCWPPVIVSSRSLRTGRDPSGLPEYGPHRDWRSRRASSHR